MPKMGEDRSEKYARKNPRWLIKKNVKGHLKKYSNKTCQKERLHKCQKEWRKKCQKKCHTICQEECGRYVPRNRGREARKSSWKICKRHVIKLTKNKYIIRLNFKRFFRRMWIDMRENVRRVCWGAGCGIMVLGIFFWKYWRWCFVKDQRSPFSALDSMV